MSHLRKLSVITIISAAMALAAPIAKGQSNARASSPPTPIEREFWEAAHRIDSVAAYQGYLSRFPDGFYAPLASAAIKKADNAGSGSVQAGYKPAVVQVESPADAVNEPFAVARIVGPTGSGAIAQRAGDVFRGPGPLTVGWLGAKKQIVIPAGEWILLAAEDNVVNHSPYGMITSPGGTSFAPPISVTTLILAKIQGQTVQSFLLARFNSREGNPNHLWADTVACGSTRGLAFTWRERESRTIQCGEARLHTHTKANLAKTFSGPVWEEAFQKLAAGGGTLPVSSFLVTDMYYTGDSSNYLRISRVDFGVSSAEPEPGAANASPDLSLLGRERWARAYSALAASGYRKRLSEEDLEPGSPPTIKVAYLPD